MKTLVKLLIAALVLHACWKSGAVFWKYYNFKDGAQAAAIFAGNRSESEIHSQVIQVARTLNVPIDPEALEVRKEPNHTYITTSYTDRIELLPTFFYPWEFTMNLDVFTLQMPSDSESVLPRK